MERPELNRKIDLAFLSAFYGGMLTEKQHRILSLYCEEDLSLGEIAEEVGISRQAAHESLTRASEKLSEMESALGVAERFRVRVRANNLTTAYYTHPGNPVKAFSLTTCCMIKKIHDIKTIKKQCNM